MEIINMIIISISIDWKLGIKETYLQCCSVYHPAHSFDKHLNALAMDKCKVQFNAGKTVMGQASRIDLDKLRSREDKTFREFSTSVFLTNTILYEAAL